MNCCYASNIQDFLLLSKEQWMQTMQSNYLLLVGEPASAEQIDAWDDCYVKSSSFFDACADFSCEIIFEYLLPREGGRRPDVLLLSGSHLIVLEYKQLAGVQQAALDQVAAYARDLKHYHSMSYDLDVIAVLVPTRLEKRSKQFDEVYACTPDYLEQLILPWLAHQRTCSLQDWLTGTYAPLPSLVSAAQAIYQNEELPYIRKANSVGIPQAVSSLIQTATQAAQQRQRILSLVTGVPGAGKTLLGLDFVHKTEQQKLANSIFLSGNGPLVDVLQYALGSKTFVSSLRNFVKEHGIANSSIPNEQIIVFDEAQRAWDQDQMCRKHRVNFSEPEIIIRIADRLPDWAMLLGLVGEGQEIHTGEEAGIGQWRDAIANSIETWTVICPPKLAPVFSGVCPVITNPQFDLNVSLRSHLADDVSSWVAQLLAGNISEASKLSQSIRQQGFHLYLTRSLERGKSYCRAAYADSTIKRYGMVASSKASILPRYQVNNSYEATKALRVGPWYNEPASHPLSCCQLTQVATEFSCQGLELDMPIVCWGEDLQWQRNGWLRFEPKNSKYKDPHQIRINSYRVLLTRGRDGVLVYLPPDTRLDETYTILLSAGMHAIDPT